MSKGANLQIHQNRQAGNNTSSHQRSGRKQTCQFGPALQFRPKSGTGDFLFRQSRSSPC